MRSPFGINLKHDKIKTLEPGSSPWSPENLAHIHSAILQVATALEITVMENVVANVKKAMENAVLKATATDATNAESEALQKGDEVAEAEAAKVVAEIAIAHDKNVISTHNLDSSSDDGIIANKRGLERINQTQTL